jgi:antitoxin (DNA-binding transcriptional repressor) of toxin-antitoxin stability system
MMEVIVGVAKTQLSWLIEAALWGEDVVIAKGEKPVVRLVPISEGQFRFGVLEPGALGDGPDFFFPMDEDQLQAWQGRSTGWSIDWAAYSSAAVMSASSSNG